MKRLAWLAIPFAIACSRRDAGEAAVADDARPLTSAEVPRALVEPVASQSPQPACAVALRERCVGASCPSIPPSSAKGIFRERKRNGGFGGTTELFDDRGVLVYAESWSDTNEYCSGTSFQIRYGVRPTGSSVPYADPAAVVRAQ